MATHLSVLCLVLLVIAFGGSLAQGSRKELKTKEMNQDIIIQGGRRPMQSRSIDPSQVVQLSWQPRIFLYRGFLSEEECDILISLVRGKKGNVTQGKKVDMKMLSANFKVSLDTEAEIAARIEERISAWTFLPKEYGKPLRVLRFGSEDSKQKYSYFDNNSTQLLGEPLLATVVLYLSHAVQGGQILFPESEKKMWSDCRKSSDTLKPAKGNAIVFFNLHLNATPDKSSSHARCPVEKGEMWCATKTFYLKGTSRENDFLQSDSVACTDEDENCPHWASLGECQRNSIFMIGSTDYYGTCRKSCNAC
ncbi:putative prolyl 4-hydroxylase 12 [Abeliophyllum distichum]|uniref:procollagen-proline 4-dioxygenase n=1 Tax=Abeliophyllum distichum TaxID=126358 RepID=A0ABD1VZV5_9LAMI